MNEPYRTIRYERSRDIGTLTLARAAKRNAQNPVMSEELAQLGAKLLRDETLRCLVVTGEGPTFSAGLDVVEGLAGMVADLAERTGDADARAAGTAVATAFNWIPELGCSSVAAVRGHALGAGLQLALACDFRVFAEGTHVGLVETRYGLLPDMGATFRLPRIVGESRARELILLGEVIDAAEALRIGLANRVVADEDLDAAAAELAGRLASQPPIAVRGARKAIDAAWHRSPEESFTLALEEQMHSRPTTSRRVGRQCSKAEAHGGEDARPLAVSTAMRASGPSQLPRLSRLSRENSERRTEMKVFVAGATGAVGKRIVPTLIARGHEVMAMTRSQSKSAELRALGADPAFADGLDRSAVMQAVMQAEPEVVIHQMTALGHAKSFKRFDKEFALTNRLRTEGVDLLIEAARAAGARRLIAQSYGNWNYERAGRLAKTEEDPLDPTPPANQRQSLEAMRYLERAVAEADALEGIALRFGNFYGPGTGFAADGDLVELVRKRRLPIVGDGAGVWSFIHVDDVATATVAALDRGAPGVYNIVDDEPAPVSEWLPALAAALGAKAPRHVPVWLGRLATGEVGVSMMTQIKGASNAKAKRELDWAPTYRSWRQGFRTGLGDALPPTRGLSSVRLRSAA